MKPVVFVWTQTYTQSPLPVSQPGESSERGILDCRGRTEQEERLRKSRRAGGRGMDGQMEATEDSVLMSD